MAYSHVFNVTSDLGSGYDRVRVDVGQTGFFEGCEFRSFYEFSADAGNALAVGATRSFKFSTPVEFILQTQLLEIDKGGVRLQVFVSATDGGGWSSVPVFAKNRSATRRVYSNGSFYVGQATVFTGGTFTGGTAVDLLRARTAAQNVAAQNVGANQDDVRYLPAGDYYVRIQPLAGVNDPSEGAYLIAWEERP